MHVCSLTDHFLNSTCYVTLVWNFSPVLLQTASGATASASRARSHTEHRSEGRRTRNRTEPINWTLWGFFFFLFDAKTVDRCTRPAPPCVPLWWDNPRPARRRPPGFSPEPELRRCGAGSWAAHASCSGILSSGRSPGPADERKTHQTGRYTNPPPYTETCLATVFSQTGAFIPTLWWNVVIIMKNEDPGLGYQCP